MMADTLSFNAKVDMVDQCKMWNGIVHHKSDRKTCVLPTADRNTDSVGIYRKMRFHAYFQRGLPQIIIFQ